MRSMFLMLFSIWLHLSVYAQRIDRPNDLDRLIYSQIIGSEIESLSRGQSLIWIYDDVGRLFFIKIDDQQFKAYRQIDKGKKRRKIKLNDNDKFNVKTILANPSMVLYLSNNNCLDMVHSFKTVTILVFKETFFVGKFYSHCEQLGEMKSIISLYRHIMR